MTDITQQALIQAQMNIVRLEVQVAHLTNSVDVLQEGSKELTSKVDQLLVLVSEARGGWKTLMLVGGAASSVGGLIAWIAGHFAKG